MCLYAIDTVGHFRRLMRLENLEDYNYGYYRLQYLATNTYLVWVAFSYTLHSFVHDFLKMFDKINIKKKTYID